MIITYVLKYFKIDVSNENAFLSSVDIDRTFLERMQAGTRAHALPLKFNFHHNLPLVPPLHL